MFSDIVKKNGSEFGDREPNKKKTQHQHQQVKHVDLSQDKSIQSSKQSHNPHRKKTSAEFQQQQSVHSSERNDEPPSFARKRRNHHNNPKVQRNPGGPRFEVSNQKINIDIDDDNSPISPLTTPSSPVVAAAAPPKPQQKQQSVKSSKKPQGNRGLVFTWDERSSFSQLAGLRINQKMAEQMRLELQKQAQELLSNDNPAPSKQEMKKSNAKLEQLIMKNSGVASFGSTLVEQSSTGQRSSVGQGSPANNGTNNSLLKNFPSLEEVNRMNPAQLNALGSNMSKAELEYISRLTEEMTPSSIIEMLSPTVRQSLKLRKYSMQTDFMKKTNTPYTSNQNQTQKSESPDSTSSPRHSGQRVSHHKNSFIQSEALFKKVTQNSNKFGTYFAPPAPSASLSVVDHNHFNYEGEYRQIQQHAQELQPVPSRTNNFFQNPINSRFSPSSQAQKHPNQQRHYLNGPYFKEMPQVLGADIVPHHQPLSSQQSLAFDSSKSLSPESRVIENTRGSSSIVQPSQQQHLVRFNYESSAASSSSHLNLHTGTHSQFSPVAANISQGGFTSHSNAVPIQPGRYAYHAIMHRNANTVYQQLAPGRPISKPKIYNTNTNSNIPNPQHHSPNVYQPVPNYYAPHHTVNTGSSHFTPAPSSFIQHPEGMMVQKPSSANLIPLNSPQQVGAGGLIPDYSLRQRIHTDETHLMNHSHGNFMRKKTTGIQARVIRNY